METYRHTGKKVMSCGAEIKVVPLHTRKVSKRKAWNRFSFGTPRRNPPSQYLAS